MAKKHEKSNTVKKITRTVQKFGVGMILKWFLKKFLKLIQAAFFW